MLGSGVTTTLMDVVAAIEDVTGKPLAYEKIPAKDLLATEPRDVIADKKDVKVLLGDSARPFVDGIRETYSYYAK
jgi:UDP-glucose 4-epimerase